MWWIWLLVALSAAVAEVAVSGLVFGGLAGAALAATVFALFIPGIVPGAIVFAAVSVVYLIVIRPTVFHRLTGLSQPRLTSHGVPASLIGRRALVTEAVTSSDGQIRIGDSEFWSARAYDEKDVFPEGEEVEIVLVEGLTALVWRPT